MLLGFDDHSTNALNIVGDNHPNGQTNPKERNTKNGHFNLPKTSSRTQRVLPSKQISIRLEVFLGTFLKSFLGAFLEANPIRMVTRTPGIHFGVILLRICPVRNTIRNVSAEIRCEASVSVCYLANSYRLVGHPDCCRMGWGRCDDHVTSVDGCISKWSDACNGCTDCRLGSRYRTKLAISHCVQWFIGKFGELNANMTDDAIFISDGSGCRNVRLWTVTCLLQGMAFGILRLRSGRTILFHHSRKAKSCFQLFRSPCYLLLLQVVFCDNTPEECTCLRERERKYLDNDSTTSRLNSKLPPTPWKQILTSPPVLALIVTQVTGSS